MILDHQSWFGSFQRNQTFKITSENKFYKFSFLHCFRDSGFRLISLDQILMEWMLRRSTQLMEWLPWLRWSSFNLFLHSAVQMYEINIFITWDLHELRNSNQTDWISLACDQALQFRRAKRPAREQASGKAAFPFVWGFRVTSRDAPIHFVIVRWRHAREQASDEAAFPFVWGFRVTSRNSPIHLFTVRCPLKQARDLQSISNN